MDIKNKVQNGIQKFKDKYVTTPEEAHAKQLESNPEQARIEQNQIEMAKRAAPDQDPVTKALKKGVDWAKDKKDALGGIASAGLGLAMMGFLNKFFPEKEEKEEEIEQDRDIKNFGFGG